MDAARDRATGEIVSGVELWLLDHVDKSGYECRGCGVPLNPVSFERGLKRRPHFKLFDGTSHEDDCDVEVLNDLKKRARYEPVSRPDGFPVSHPNRLELLERQVVVRSPERIDADGHAASGWQNSSRSAPDPSAARRRRHNWIARTIRPLVRHYMQFPHDRHLALHVPSVDGRTFRQVFKRLFYLPDVYFTEPRIYYGSLHLRRSIEGEDFVDVWLSQGEWDRSRSPRQLVHPYVVRIHTAGWSERKRNYVLDEIDVAREEARVAVHSGDSETRAWLFFLSRQDAEDRFLFHVDDHRLICCEADTLISGAGSGISSS